MIKFTRKNTGFTLIETLIAMVILAIGILGIWKMHTAVYSTDAYSNHLSQATSLANEQLEDLKAAGYSSLSNGSNSTQKTGVSGKRYHLQSVIADANGTCKLVTISVGWNNNGSIPASVSSSDFTVQVDSIVADLSQ